MAGDEGSSGGAGGGGGGGTNREDEVQIQIAGQSSPLGLVSLCSLFGYVSVLEHRFVWLSLHGVTGMRRYWIRSIGVTAYGCVRSVARTPD